jgi:hypothetical protein
VRTSQQIEEHVDGTSWNDDSDDGDDEDDPIYSVMRRERRKQPLTIDEGTAESVNGVLNSLEKGESFSSDKERNKKTHRFMDDLENRMAQPEKEEFQQYEEHQQEDTSESSSRPRLWIEGLKSFRQKPATSPRKYSTAPLTRKKDPQKPELEPEEVEKFTSTNILDDEEMEELVRLRQQSSDTSPTAIIFALIRQHPREAFVVFTLLFGILMYFLKGRNLSVDDEGR